MFRIWEVDVYSYRVWKQKCENDLLSSHSLGIFMSLDFIFSPLQEICYRWDLWLIRQLLKQHDQRALSCLLGLKFFFSLNYALKKPNYLLYFQDWNHLRGVRICNVLWHFSLVMKYLFKRSTNTSFQKKVLLYFRSAL